MKFVVSLWTLKLLGLFAGRRNLLKEMLAGSVLGFAMVPSKAPNTQLLSTKVPRFWVISLPLVSPKVMPETVSVLFPATDICWVMIPGFRP